jgi:ribosomally synthesized peptide (two-chain TOMM family)
MPLLGAYDIQQDAAEEGKPQSYTAELKRVVGAPKNLAAARTAHAEDVIGALKSFLEWRRTWGRAVALAWSSNALRDELIANPDEFFFKHCNYVVPHTTVIKVIADEKAKYDPNTASWEHINATVLTIYLPGKPDEAKFSALALSDYMAAGLDNSASFCC